MELVDGFSNGIFDNHALGIPINEFGECFIELITHQQRWVIVPRP